MFVRQCRRATSPGETCGGDDGIHRSEQGQTPKGRLIGGKIGSSGFDLLCGVVRSRCLAKCNVVRCHLPRRRPAHRSTVPFPPTRVTAEQRQNPASAAPEEAGCQPSRDGTEPCGDVQADTPPGPVIFGEASPGSGFGEGGGNGRGDEMDAQGDSHRPGYGGGDNRGEEQKPAESNDSSPSEGEKGSFHVKWIQSIIDSKVNRYATSDLTTTTTAARAHDSRRRRTPSCSTCCTGTLCTFDWYLKSRDAVDLQRRGDSLIRLVHKEEPGARDDWTPRQEVQEQTVKELLDNAVDACRCRTSGQDAPTVRVVLRRRCSNKTNVETREDDDLGEQDEPLELQVADNGDGLRDVTKALVLFSSSKSGHGSSSPTTPDACSTAGENKESRQKSNKKHKHGNAGKYGLGLTLSLLYSQEHFGGFLKATTARRDSREWTLTKCDINLETGLPRTLYSKTGFKPDSWSQGCGTDMRLLVPGGEDALDFAEPRLKALFARMHLLPDRAAGVSFVCQGCLHDTSIVVPRGGREASPHLLIDNQDLVRAFAKGLTAMARDFDGVGVFGADGVDRGVPSSPSSPPSTGSMGGVDQDGELVVDRHRAMGLQEQQPETVPTQNRGQSQSQSQSQSLRFGSFSHGVGVGEGLAGSGSSSRPSSARRVDTASGLGYLYSNFAEEDVVIFECQREDEGTNTSWVSAGVAVERALPSRREPESVGTDERTVPLFVHRFANGVPMLDTNTSPACALVGGVASKAGWASLGLKISASRVQRRDGRLRFTLSEAPTPLKVEGGVDWSALSDIKAVHVAVTATSEAIPYTSLRKDAIAHREGYVSATEGAVRQGLVALCRRTSGGFRSAFEAANHMLHKELLPIAASSVASMVSHSADVSFQKRCLVALGVVSKYEYVQERRLCDLIQLELTENVREEEARRVAAKARTTARIKEQKRGKQNTRGERRGSKTLEVKEGEATRDKQPCCRQQKRVQQPAQTVDT
eukprot:g11106.t1